MPSSLDSMDKVQAVKTDVKENNSDDSDVDITAIINKFEKEISSVKVTSVGSSINVAAGAAAAESTHKYAKTLSKTENQALSTQSEKNEKVDPENGNCLPYVISTYYVYFKLVIVINILIF